MCYMYKFKAMCYIYKLRVMCYMHKFKVMCYMYRLKVMCYMSKCVSRNIFSKLGILLKVLSMILLVEAWGI